MSLISKTRRNLSVASAVFILAAAFAAFGHNPMASWAVARVYDDRVELDVELSGESAWALLGGAPGVAPKLEPELDRLASISPSFYVVTENGAPLSPASPTAEMRDVDAAGAKLVFKRGSGGELRFEAAFLRLLPAGHRTTLTIIDASDKVLKTAPLTSASSAVTVAAGPNGNGGREYSFAAFFVLGIEHILTGYDHLLFLFGLLIVCRRFSTAAQIVTCFTIAHSITLALAALDVVAIPGRVVEPLIAASIVVVAFENIFRRDEPRWRWALTFALGLIHGFGFAGALRESGLGAGGAALLVPLLSFNLGVETGQIALAALALPLLWRFQKTPAFDRFGRVALSSAVALAGVYWLISRLSF